MFNLMPHVLINILASLPEVDLNLERISIDTFLCLDLVLKRVVRIMCRII